MRQHLDNNDDHLTDEDIRQIQSLGMSPVRAVVMTILSGLIGVGIYSAISKDFREDVMVMTGLKQPDDEAVPFDSIPRRIDRAHECERVVNGMCYEKRNR